MRLGVMTSIAELTISDSIGKIGVFQPNGNKSVENLASNYRLLWWFSVICQIKVDNVTKQATYGSCLAITTLLRASKAQSNLRPRNIVKKEGDCSKKIDQVKEVNKWPDLRTLYTWVLSKTGTDRPYKRSLSLISERASFFALTQL